MYEDRVLVYMDCLGFSDAIKNTIVNGVENEDETKKIASFFGDAEKMLGSQPSYPGDTSKAGRHAHHFSDSMVISYPKTADGVFRIVVEVLFLALAALKKGFLLRGAIVCDKLYHTETQIFGPALVKAYQMETRLAVYPQIILDDAILGIAQEYPQEFPSERKRGMERFKAIQYMLLTDFDGYSFINYLDVSCSDILSAEIIPEYFEPLRVKMEKMAQEEDPGIKSKYLWLKGKYNDVLSKYKKWYVKDKAKEEYPAAYNYIKTLLKDSGADSAEGRNAKDHKRG